MAPVRNPMRLAAPVVWLILLLLPQTAGAASPARTGGDLRFERVGFEGGPPSQVITSIWQDRTGFLWLGSREGLALYDGHSFEVFEHDASDPTSLSDNTVRTVYEDRENNLWIGTNAGGLNRLDRATWEFERFRHDSSDPGSLSHDSVNAVLQDRSGVLWVGTQVGLNRFDPASGTFERIPADPTVAGSLSHDYVYALYEDRDARLWVATVDGGLNLRDRETDRWVVFRHDPGNPDSLCSDQVFTMAEDDSGDLWVGTSKGLTRLDRETNSLRCFRHDPEDPTSLGNDLVTSIAPGSPGSLWIGTHGGGVSELDVASGSFKVWRHDPARRTSLSEDKVIALLRDDAGALWIGTWGGGLNRLTKFSMLFTTTADRLTTPESFEIPDVTSLMHDHLGEIWIGTRTGKLIRRNPAAGTAPLQFRDGLGQVLALFEDSGGAVWVGTSAGLFRFDRDSGETLRALHDPQDPNSLGPGYVRAILEDREGRLWVGTGEGGVHLIDRDARVLKRFTHDPSDPASLSDNYVTVLLEDHRGTLWVGTRSGGLNALDPATGRAVQYRPDPDDESALSHHLVTSIFEDSRKRLWVGTAGGGLNRVDQVDGGPARFSRFTERDGLVDNDVMSILEDDDGSLWLSTKRGLARFDPESTSVANFYMADGLPASEFEPGAAARGADTLCLGSVEGIVEIPAGTTMPTPSPSPTVIKSIGTATGEIRSDRPAWGLDSLEIPYGEWLSIQLAVLDYSSKRRDRYAYRLGGEWIDLGYRRDITFTALVPGIHEFSAKGRNSQGVWSEVPSTLLIRVVPPLWMTTWFRVAMAFFVVAVAIAGHLRRTSVLEKRNRELLFLHEQREKARQELGRAYERLSHLTRRLEAVKEDERKHIARELHDDMGPSLTAVIINLQLLSKKADAKAKDETVAETIDLVDRIIQRVRDLSLDLRPPLLDELGLVPALKGYLETQTERAGIELEVSGETAAEGLQPEVAITAFRVIQEAVTNVIRHAAATRASVSVRQKNGELVLTVRDDGRGFEVRDTIEGAATGKALGLLGMQERVRMLGGEINFASAPGKGTSIHVRMPVEVAS